MGSPDPQDINQCIKFQLPLTAFLKQRLHTSPTRVPLLGTKSPLPPQGLPGHPLSPSPHRCHHIPRLQPRSAPWMPHPKSSTEPNLCLKPVHPPWVCSAPGRSSLNLGAGAAAWLQHHPVPTQSTAPVPHGAKSLGHGPPPTPPGFGHPQGSPGPAPCALRRLPVLPPGGCSDPSTRPPRSPPPRILGAQRGWGHPGTADPTAHLSPYPR